MKTPLLVLYAPTASGKTSLMLTLASNHACEVISADSRQVFKRLDIGTAKPTLAERASVAHHLVDILEPDEKYSAGRFANDAARVIQEVYARHRVPVVVGGSGLYIHALCSGLFDDGSSTISASLIAETRERLKKQLDEQGRDALYDELRRLDPVSAQKYADKNPSRIMRALEYYSLHNIPLSLAHSGKHRESSFEVFYFVLERDADELALRIHKRTRQMWDMGLADETLALLDSGYPEDIQCLRTVGYKETLQFLKSELSEMECIQLIEQNTRRYAKRQRTWGRHQLDHSTCIRGDESHIARSLESSILNILHTLESSR